MLKEVCWNNVSGLFKYQKKKEQIPLDAMLANKDEFQPRQLAASMEDILSHQQQKNVAKMIFKFTKTCFIGLAIGIPFLSASVAIVPICIFMFQSTLQPEYFFECNDDPEVAFMEQLSVSDGYKKEFEKLWLYLVLIFVSKLVYAVSTSFCEVFSFRAACSVQCGIMQLCFNKLLKLQPNYAQNSQEMSVANILISDTQRIQQSFIMMHSTFSVPIEVIISICYLAAYIDPISLFGVALLLVFVPVLFGLSKTLQNCFEQLDTMRDHRVQKVQEILNAMKIVKLFQMEDYHQSRIMNMRKNEFKLIKRAFNCIISIWVLGFTSCQIMITLAVGCLMAFGKLDLTQTFTMSFLFTNIQSAMEYFPLIIMSLQDTIVSCRRINQFLNIPEVNNSYIRQEEDSKSDRAIAIDTPISFSHFSDVKNQQVVLNNIKLNIQCGELVGIEGPVGSGKSSLLKSLLGELFAVQKQDNAFVTLNGKLAYCPQTSPIFSMSVRENILFFNEFDQAKYDRIVDICCLLPDFQQFADSDNTIVGSRGVTLSGGQRARICLARALYQDADIYLLDDPLSAVDAHVGKRIWNEVILSYLFRRGKTVLIASHQTHYFKDCTKIIQLDHAGNISEETQVSEFASQCSSSTVQPTSNSITEVPTIKEKNTRDHKNSQQSEPQQEEIENNTAVSLQNYLHYIKSGSVALLACFVVLAMLWQVSTQYNSVLLSTWMEDGYGLSSKNDNPPEVQQVIDKASVLYGDHEFISTYAQTCYYQHIGEESPEQTVSNTYFYIYLGIAVLSAILFFFANFSFTRFHIAAAKNLHQNLMTALINTRLAFFDVTPQGKIISRAGRDTEVTDIFFGRYFLLGFDFIILVCGIIIVISVTSWPNVFISIITLALFGWIFATFRKSYPQLRRYEALLRSQLLSVSGEVADQVEYIRASQVQECFTNIFSQRAQDLAEVTFNGCSLTKWLSFRLMLIAGLFTVLVTLVVMLISPLSPTISQFAAMIVSQSFSIQYLLLSGLDVINMSEGEMPGIERLLEYGSLERGKSTLSGEKVGQEEKKIDQTGLIIKNLKMRYRPELQLTLKGVNLTIQPAEHIGVIGRTGSGKSSLTLSLYQLYQVLEGSRVYLDGELISHLDLKELRSKFSIIPQEPYLFSGTLRQNLCQYSRNKSEGLPTDGLKKLTDQELWSLLELVDMKDVVQGLPDTLDCKVIGNGENFSSGQRQLICVARALAKSAQVMILDEATAYVDQKTDKIIQDIVKVTLKDKIVISIAHRLQTIMEMDKIAVMDAGLIKEFGTPEELLKIEDGIFTEQAKQAGIVPVEEVTFEDFKKGEQNTTQDEQAIGDKQ